VASGSCGCSPRPASTKLKIGRPARAALVLKGLTHVLPVSPRCTYIKGNGGAEGAVRQVSDAMNCLVLPDVGSYYASIDHMLSMDRLAR